MKNEKNGYAILSGVFLLLPFVLLLMFFVLYRNLLAEASFLLYAAARVILPALAGIFLILRRPRAAAVVMTLVAVLVLLLELPEFPRYLEPNGYLATYDEASGYTEYIPRQFVVLPILSILAALCFAAALYLRGRPAMLLAVLAAAVELVYMNRQLASVSYVTGHPGPNALFPFDYAIAAFFAGLYLRSLKKQDPHKEDET